MVRAYGVSVFSVLVCLLVWQASAAPLSAVSPYIRVDQFGYLPEMKKVAVISDPQQGFNAAAFYTPGANLEVRRWPDQQLILRGKPSLWNSGATHAQSGDRVWWFDFSTVTRAGSYYIYDPNNKRRSEVFNIGANVYREVMKQALRMFFYQRCGQAKQQPFADARWTDNACHLHDRQARFIHARNDATTERDLSGGWHDAGDYNKYTILTAETLSDLLLAYENNPRLWTDDFNLPESGNGVPDILDEIKWELDWLLKMQNQDGGVLTKLSAADFQSASPPSTDLTLRFYGAPSTAATLAAATSYAHAALVFQAFLPGYAGQLRTAAERAWQWAARNPQVLFDNTGFGSESTEVDDYKRAMLKLTAAIYLFALTQETPYQDYLAANYRSTHMLQWDYWHCYESLIQDALLYYAALPLADPALASELRRSSQSAIAGPDFLTAYLNTTDAYRSYLKDDLYTWGSNRLKSRVGLLFFNQNVYRLNTTNAPTYAAAGAEYLHYLHGVNPMGLVYLTNMYGYGGETCVNEIFHRWFKDGSEYDNAQTSLRGPAPGYLSGGPNRGFKPSPEYQGTLLQLLASQPAQKAYLDWNGDWPENSWEITEPAIYYQAAYVNLLATASQQYGSSQ